MKPRILTTILICSATLTTTVTPAIAATTTSNVTSELRVPAGTKSQDNQLIKATQVDQKKPTDVEQTVGTFMVGPKQIVAGAIYGFNVHARQIKTNSPETISLNVFFDPAKFDYVDADRTLGGDKTKVELDNTTPGKLRITSSAKLSKAEFLYYAQTRLAHINLRVKENVSGRTQIHFEQAIDQSEIELGSPLNLEIQAKNPLDYNGDGIIGVGDVALAPKDKKAIVAEKAEIKPYKHVIVLTTDGGGDPWDPNGIFYADRLGFTRWTKNHKLMKNRQNTYTMDLFNKQFAMSTTAQSVNPSISAQNYISMLHGRPWAMLPTQYQGTNESMGQQYFADFGKETPWFPSIFKVLQKNNPNQRTAAFSEWGAIVNAIVEPDAAVKTKQSDAWKSFDDVADYIGTDDFNNTSLVYMQSDQMDHQGHNHGWYNKAYWNQYKRYDQLFKKVMDKLEATGHIHDTLVIANSDHGGHRKNHGQNYGKANRSIYIAMGGETVDSGRRLHGGSNSDISALVLNALQMQPAPHMRDSKVFDKSAFLDQTELTKKNRDVEAIKVNHQKDEVKIEMANLKERKINAVDLQFNLAGRTMDSIQPAEGVQVLRQTIKDGILKLTVSVDHQPTTGLATIKLKPESDKNAKKVIVEQVMASTVNGTEILVDLINNRD